MVDFGQGPLPSGQTLVRTIDVAAIRPCPYQPRRSVAPEDLVELVASIREHGVLQPVLVRPMDGYFELVAGERRWRAAEAAGLRAIPAVVREVSERDAALLALVENLQRTDLHFFEEAEGYRQLVEEFRLSQDELAAQVGKSQPAVANKLRLLKLEASVRRRVEEAGLSERHARSLLALEDEGARLAAVEAFVSGEMTARQADDWVAKRGGDRPRAAGRVGSDVPTYLRRLERVAKDLGRAGYVVELARDEDEQGWTIRLRIARPAGAEDGGRA